MALVDVNPFEISIVMMDSTKDSHPSQQSIILPSNRIYSHSAVFFTTSSFQRRYNIGWESMLAFVAINSRNAMYSDRLFTPNVSLNSEVILSNHAQLGISQYFNKSCWNTDTNQSTCGQTRRIILHLDKKRNFRFAFTRPKLNGYWLFVKFWQVSDKIELTWNIFVSAVRITGWKSFVIFCLRLKTRKVRIRPSPTEYLTKRQVGRFFDTSPPPPLAQLNPLWTTYRDIYFSASVQKLR